MNSIPPSIEFHQTFLPEDDETTKDEAVLSSDICEEPARDSVYIPRQSDCHGNWTGSANGTLVMSTNMTHMSSSVTNRPWHRIISYGEMMRARRQNVKPQDALKPTSTDAVLGSEINRRGISQMRYEVFQFRHHSKIGREWHDTIDLNETDREWEDPIDRVRRTEKTKAWLTPDIYNIDFSFITPEPHFPIPKTVRMKNASAEPWVINHEHLRFSNSLKWPGNLETPLPGGELPLTPFRVPDSLHVWIIQQGHLYPRRILDDDDMELEAPSMRFNWHWIDWSRGIPFGMRILDVGNIASKLCTREGQPLSRHDVVELTLDDWAVYISSQLRNHRSFGVTPTKICMPAPVSSYAEEVDGFQLDTFLDIDNTSFYPDDETNQTPAISRHKASQRRNEEPEETVERPSLIFDSECFGMETVFEPILF